MQQAPRVDANAATLVDVATASLDSCFDEDEDQLGCRMRTTRIQVVGDRLMLEGEVMSCNGRVQASVSRTLSTEGPTAREPFERDSCGYLRDAVKARDAWQV